MVCGIPVISQFETRDNSSGEKIDIVDDSECTRAAMCIQGTKFGNMFQRLLISSLCKWRSWPPCFLRIGYNRISGEVPTSQAPLSFQDVKVVAKRLPVGIGTDSFDKPKPSCTNILSIKGTHLRSHSSAHPEHTDKSAKNSLQLSPQLIANMKYSTTLVAATTILFASLAIAAPQPVTNSDLAVYALSLPFPVIFLPRHVV